MPIHSVRSSPVLLSHLGCIRHLNEPPAAAAAVTVGINTLLLYRTGPESEGTVLLELTRVRQEISWGGGGTSPAHQHQR